MALQVVTASLSSENPQSTQVRTWYETRLIDTLHHWLVLGLFADSSSVIPTNNGQTVSWRQLSRLAAATTALTEGAAGSATNLVYTEVTAAVLQYGDWIEWSDTFIKSGPDARVSSVKGLQGRQAALTIDTLIQTELLNGSNVAYAGNATSRVTLNAGDMVDADDLDTAIAAMKNNHVPMVTGFINGSNSQSTVTGLPAYVGVCNPDVEGILRGLTGFNGVETYAGQTTLLPSEIGKYRDIRFVLTTNSLTTAATTSAALDAHFIHIFGQGAFGISGIGMAGASAVQSMDRAVDNPEKGDELGQTGSVGWKLYFVPKILDASKLYRIETTIA